MSRYLDDPICYCLEFSCVTAQPSELLIKQEFIHILRALWPMLKPLMIEGWASCCFDRRDDQKSQFFILPNDEEMFVQQTELIPLKASEDEKMGALYAILIQENTQRCSFGLNGDFLGDLRKAHQPKSTKFAREYWQHFQKEYNEWSPRLRERFGISEDIFQTSPVKICAFLNRPSPTLDDVIVPMMMTNHFTNFIMYMYSRPLMKPPINRKEVYVCDLGRIGNDLRPEHAFLHRMSFVLPRLFYHQAEEVTLIQKLFTDALKTLGEQYPLCRGAVYSDFPGTYCGLPEDVCYSAYDSVTRFSEHKRYLSDYIPGYAWGMLINPTMVKDKSRLKAYQREGEFSEALSFDNGNMYFQMTDDLNYMTVAKCAYLRKVFKPDLPPVDLPFCYNDTPPSFRLGFSPEEIRLIPFTPRYRQEAYNGLDVMIVTHST